MVKIRYILQAKGIILFQCLDTDSIRQSSLALASLKNTTVHVSHWLLCYGLKGLRVQLHSSLRSGKVRHYRYTADSLEANSEHACSWDTLEQRVKKIGRTSPSWCEKETRHCLALRPKAGTGIQKTSTCHFV